MVIVVVVGTVNKKELQKKMTFDNNALQLMVISTKYTNKYL